MAAGSRRLARAVPARPARDDDESLRSPSRRQVSRDRRWAEILGVAGELMADSGTGALRLRDVAAQLGIRYQALYYYVDSKDELVHAVLREAIGRALAELRRRPRPAGEWRAGPATHARRAAPRLAGSAARRSVWDAGGVPVRPSWSAPGSSGQS